MANIRHEGTLRVLDVSPGVHVSMSVRVGPADLDALEREITAIRGRRGI